MWRYAHRFPEQEREAVRTELGDSGELGQANVGPLLAVDEIKHAPQLHGRKAALCRGRIGSDGRVTSGYVCRKRERQRLTVEAAGRTTCLDLDFHVPSQGD